MEEDEGCSEGMELCPVHPPLEAEFGQMERLPSLSCSAADASEALAQPSSRPRRVPGGPVAGDWERSPLGPCAGTAREGEAPAAVARPAAGTVPAQAPFLGPRPGARSVRTKSSLETPRTAGKGLRLLWYTLGWSLVGVYIGRKKQRPVLW